MSDTPSDIEIETDKPLAGMRLAEARRAQDISTLDIAKELHLDEPKVRALEENNFEMLGAPVFAKGHLRKYAELVGVSTDDILADYYSLNRAVGAPPVVGPVRKRERDYHLGQWLAAIAIIALLGAVVAAAYWWYENRVAESVAQGNTAVLAPFTSAVQKDVDASTDSALASDLPEPTEVGDTPGESGAVVAAAAPPEQRAEAVEFVSSATASSPSDVPQATLTIRFSGDCWTEVSDATGKRLYFDLGVAGRSVTVTGTAPLRALFGDSVNVRVEVNGRDFVIPASMISGRTARLTVNAP